MARSLRPRRLIPSVVVTTRGIAPGAHIPTTAAVLMLRPRKALAVGRTVAPGASLHHLCIRVAAAHTSAVVCIERLLRLRTRWCCCTW